MGQGGNIDQRVPTTFDGKTLISATRIDPPSTPVYASFMEYAHLITLEPDKRSGQACIRGLRMTVRDVLEYLAAGMTPQEIVDEFPDLTLEDIRACLAYAADRERRLWVVPAA